MQGEPEVADASVTLHQPEACRVLSRGSCPWITAPGSGGMHRLLGGETWIVTCARTQTSWWLLQQP